MKQDSNRRRQAAALRYEPKQDRAPRLIAPSVRAPALAGGSYSGFRPADARAGAAGLPLGLHKGQGALAEKLLELARQHDIPIRHDKNLLEILSRLDLNEEIPPEVYQVVAEILAFICRLSDRRLAK